jgi:hypothetical protein
VCLVEALSCWRPILPRWNRRVEGPSKKLFLARKNTKKESFEFELLILHQFLVLEDDLWYERQHKCFPMFFRIRI